jgi:ankyrin repeat protein
MFAVLYSDAALVREMVERVANVNARNDAGATALMWAVGDLDTTRVLVDRGADINLRSADGRTALMIAAGTGGATDVVKLLLDRGADVNVVGSALYGPTTALTESALVGNEAAFNLLVAAGADLTAGPATLGLALRAGCMKCAEAILKVAPPPLITGTMLNGGPPAGPALGTPMFLDRSASLAARDAEGRSMLMLAAASDAMPMDAVKALLARKMDVNERTRSGVSALNLARRHGDTPIVKLLLDAGAQDEPAIPVPTPSPASSPREAVARAVPLLQKSDVTFLGKSGCVSCHNNSLTQLALAAARKVGVDADAAVAAGQAKRIARQPAFDRSIARAAVWLRSAPVRTTEDRAFQLLGMKWSNSSQAQSEQAGRALLAEQRADGGWAQLPTMRGDAYATGQSLYALVQSER